jgi:hypothetical protein
MKFLLLCLYFISYGANAKPFGMKELLSLMTWKEVRTIDQLLTYLPDDLKMNYTVQWHSHGLQEANEKYPRIIMFSSNGQIYISFNGHPQQKKYNKLEIMEFHYPSGKYVLFEIDFPIISRRGEKYTYRKHLKTNPSKCLECHGKIPRPIFGDYGPSAPGVQEWPGFHNVYNGNDHYKIVDFNLKRKKLPRYRHLKEMSREYLSSAGKLHHHYCAYPDKMPYHVCGMYGRNNLRLMDYLYWTNSRRISYQIKKHKNYIRLLPLLIFLLNTSYGGVAADKNCMSVAGDKLNRFDRTMLIPNDYISALEITEIQRKLTRIGARFRQRNQIDFPDIMSIFNLKTKDLVLEDNLGTINNLADDGGFWLGLGKRAPLFLASELFSDFKEVYGQKYGIVQLYGYPHVKNTHFKKTLDKIALWSKLHINSNEQCKGLITEIKEKLL